MTVLLEKQSDRIEAISLDKCSPGDILEINHRRPGAMWALPRLCLVKVKTLTGGDYQIKYRYHHLPNVVHKATIPKAARVYRVIPIAG